MKYRSVCIRIIILAKHLKYICYNVYQIQIEKMISIEGKKHIKPLHFLCPLKTVLLRESRKCNLYSFMYFIGLDYFLYCLTYNQSICVQFNFHRWPLKKKVTFSKKIKMNICCFLNKPLHRNFCLTLNCLII